MRLQIVKQCLPFLFTTVALSGNLLPLSILPDLKPNLAHSLRDCVEGITTQGPFAILPNDSWPAMIRVDDPVRIPLVRTRQLYFYFCGTISYSDAGEEKIIPLCAVYDEAFGRMGTVWACKASRNPQYPATNKKRKNGCLPPRHIRFITSRITVR